MARHAKCYKLQMLAFKSIKMKYKILDTTNREYYILAI